MHAHWADESSPLFERCVITIAAAPLTAARAQGVAEGLSDGVEVAYTD